MSFYHKGNFFRALQHFQDRRVLSLTPVSNCMEGEHHSLPVSQVSSFYVFLYQWSKFKKKNDISLVILEFF